jgi:exopolysaccharide biosynthesis polyprenyl glycosylphosphotransferase
MSSHAGRIQSAPADASYPHTVLLSLKAQRFLLRTVLILADILVLGLAFKTAFWFRFDLQWTVSPGVVPDPEFYPSVAAVLIPGFVLIFMFFRLYDPQLILGGVGEYSRIFNACTTGAICLVLITFIEPRFIISRMWVISAWVLSFLLISLNRFFWRRVVYQLRPKGYLLVPSVIVGTNQEARALAHDLHDWRASGLRILGFVSSDSRAVKENYAGLPILGTVGDIQAIVEEHEIEDLVVSITAISREELLQLCEAVNPYPEVQLRLSSGLYELLTTGVTVKTLGSVPLVSINKIRLAPEEVFIKSLLDYTMALLGLLVLAPLMILLAVLIKSDSPGPIFYRRRVLGVGGAAFDAFKFRTMREDGDSLLAESPELAAQFQENHKLKVDPRVTRFGQFLRRYSLDELPQLFNVLLGQMGLVGPRMISPEEATKYGRHKLNLLTVKPGITGLWQVSGRSDLTYEERVRLDMYYIRNYSLWLDLQILFVQTLPAVMKSRGAY